MTAQSMIAQAEAAPGRPPLWRATTERGTITLFGSLHALPAHAVWFHASLARALSESDAVIFESVDGSRWLNSLRAIPAVTGSRETNVLALLSEPDRSTFLNLVQELGLEGRQWKTLRPFMVTAYLGAAYNRQRFGLDARFGVEARLKSGFGLRKKHLGLEDPLTVTRAIGGAPIEAQMRQLVDTMHSLDSRAERQMRVTEAWQASDVATLSKLLSREANEFKAEGLYAPMVSDRHAAWIDKLGEYAGTYGNLLVVVGIGHLVYEDGFLETCRRAGLTFNLVT